MSNSAKENRVWDEICDKAPANPMEIHDYVNVPAMVHDGDGNESCIVGTHPFQTYPSQVESEESQKAILAGTLSHPLPEFRKTMDLKEAARLVNYGGWSVTGIFRLSPEPSNDECSVQAPKTLYVLGR